MKNILKIVQTNMSILFIVFVWIIFSHQYFIFGKIPFPSTYQVNHFPPWSHYEKFWGPVKNDAMPDIIDQIYPWRFLTINMWKNGQVPLWNPYNFAGTPHLANFQSTVFSPFNVLFFVLPFVDAWSILILLQPLLAAYFTYLFLRVLNISKTASLIGAITYMFSGFVVVWMAYETLSFTILFLPLALFAIEKYSQTKQLKFLMLLSLTFPLSFFSGHFQTSIYFTLFVFVYTLFKHIQIKSTRTTLYILLYILFGVLLILPQVFPSIELYMHSVRSEIYNTGGGIPFHYLVTLFAPDFYGNPVTRNDWLGHYAEWASFVGMIPFILVLMSFDRKNKAVVFFWITGGIFLLLVVDSPLQTFIGTLKLPVLSTSNPTRIITLFSFSLAVLASFGLDILVNAISRKKWRRIFTMLLIPAICIGVIWLTLLLGTFLPTDKTIIAQKNFLLPTVLLGCFIVLIVWVKFFHSKKFLIFFPVILLIFTSFDSLRFAIKWMPFDPKNLVFQDIPVITAMQNHIGSERYLGNLGAQIASYYQLSSLEGYDPLYIKRYGEFIRTAYSGRYLSAERSVVKLDRGSKYIYSILDITNTHLIYHPKGDTNQSWAFPVWNNPERFQKIYEDDKYELYKNTLSLPQANLFFDYEVMTKDKDILSKFYSEKFDYRNKIILEEDPKITKQGGLGMSSIKSYLPNFIEINTQSSSSSLLFLADNYYPGWVAAVDGKPAKIYRANYTFRAIVVPKGSHTVQFRYAPKSLEIGMSGFLIGVLGIVSIPFIKKRWKK